MSHLSERTKKVIEAFGGPSLIDEAVDIEHKDFSFHGFLRDIILMIQSTSATDGQTVTIVMSPGLYQRFKDTMPLLGMAAFFTGKRDIATTIMLMDIQLKSAKYNPQSDTFGVSFRLQRKLTILRLRQVANYAERIWKEANK